MTAIVAGLVARWLRARNRWCLTAPFTWLARAACVRQILYCPVCLHGATRVGGLENRDIALFGQQHAPHWAKVEMNFVDARLPFGGRIYSDPAEP